MRTLPHAVVAATGAALLMTACGGSDDPEPPPPPGGEPTSETVAPATETGEAATSTQEAPEPPPEAEAGLLIAGVTDDLARTDRTEVAEGTFGTPGGTLEIRSVSSAETIPGQLVGGTDDAYLPAAGEEFYIFDLSLAASDDGGAPATELYLDSQGTSRQIEDLPPGESSVVVSLPAGAEGATLRVSADGHEQVFDIADAQRQPDQLGDVYLRPVVQQDLTDVLDFGPVADENRDFTADIRMRSAHITPYVPTNVGSQGWAEPGSLWLILEYEADHGATRSGWSRQHVTLTWEIEGETLVQEGRLWGAGAEEVVVSLPDDIESIEVEVANRLEVSQLSDGEPIIDFGSQSFEVTFPNE